MAYLYRYECKGLQEWILASGKLGEIAAASDLLNALPALRQQACAAAGVRPEVIAEAGGGGWLAFDTMEDLERFAATWPMRMDAALPGLQVLQAWSSAADAQAYREIRQVGLAAARNRAFPVIPEAGPLTERAGRTAQAAVGRLRGSRDAGRLLDRASMRKFLWLRQQGQHGLADRFGLRESELPFQDGDFPEGRLAVIHADGNGIGQELARRNLTADGLRAFSAALARATERAARTATKALCDDGGLAPGRVTEKGNRKLPIRPLVLGGDDVTVLVHAQHALPWAWRFLEAFERACRDDAALGPFTACAGVVFCKANWPYHHAYTIADALCRAAKDGLRRLDPDGRTASGLLFHRLTGSMETDWRIIASAELAGGVLCGGPYALIGDQGPTRRGLAELADTAASLPRSALRGWFDDIARDATQARAAWERMVEVLDDVPERKPKFTGCLRQHGVDESTGLWARGPRAGHTPLFDALLWNRMQSGSKLQATGATGED